MNPPEEGQREDWGWDGPGEVRRGSEGPFGSVYGRGTGLYDSCIDRERLALFWMSDPPIPTLSLYPHRIPWDPPLVSRKTFRRTFSP